MAQDPVWARHANVFLIACGQPEAVRRAQAEAFGVPDRDRLLQLGPGDAGCRRGQVALALVDLPSTLPHIKSGKLKALAVTGATRSAFLPEVPTFAQAGVPGYESTGWFGVVAPAATPPAVLKRLQTEFSAVLADRQVIANVNAIGVELTPSSPDEFDKFIRAETGKWAEVIKTSGTRLE